MTDPGKRATLRRVPAFAQLSDYECDVVLNVLKAKRGGPKDVLFKEGELGKTLLIVLEGQLIATSKAEVVARLGPGEVVGELAFVDDDPRSATVAAGDQPVTVLEFTRGALALLARDAPRAAAAILGCILGDVARRLRAVGGRLASGGAVSERGPVSLGRPGRQLSAEQLRTIPAFGGYSKEELELLAMTSSCRQFAQRDVLMRAGMTGESCFLIASGSVDVTRPDTTATIATLGAGALVGQLALIDRAPRSATVTATTDTVALEIRGDQFQNLVRAWSPIALRFQWQVALAGVRQLRVATKLLSETLSERGWDDWEPAASPASLELAIEPRGRREA